VEKSKLKRLGHPQPQAGIEKNTYYLRCLRCGDLVHWTSSVCKKCLANPLQERRETPRIRFQKTFVHDGLFATILNIGVGGVQIKTKTSLSVGEVLKLAFSLEDGIARFGGIVVYAQSLSNGNLLAGVRFSDLSPRDAGPLNRFLRSG